MSLLDPLEIFPHHDIKHKGPSLIASLYNPKAPEVHVPNVLSHSFLHRNHMHSNQRMTFASGLCPFLQVPMF